MSVIGPGRPFTQTATLPQPPEVAQQQLFMAIAGVQGATPVNAGPGAILVTRRFIPTWAIVLAVIGFFFLFIGLLFLLVRSTETLEIRVGAAPDGQGSTIAINGTADSDIITRLQGVLMMGQPVGWPGQPYGGLPPQTQMYPQPFAQQPYPPQQPVSAGPRQPPLSADGRYWWDGAQWRPTGLPDGPSTAPGAPPPA